MFEELAWAKAHRLIAFVNIDLVIGKGSMVAHEHGAVAMWTFGFPLDGKKVRVWQARLLTFCCRVGLLADS